MIYMRDGKLLVSADGKLCSTCCPCSENICVTPAGITECDPADYPWPNALPTPAQIARISEDATWCIYNATVDNFGFYAKWNKTTEGWNVFCIYHQDNGRWGIDFRAFDPDSLMTSPLSSIDEEADCGDTKICWKEGPVCGHSGTVTIAWESCP